MGKVLILRTSDKDGRSYNGFQWPESGPVECSDWSPEAKCGHGLHGLLWGEGDGSLLDWSETARWQVVSVDDAEIVVVGRKVKFPRGEVLFTGNRPDATTFLLANGGQGKAVAGALILGGHHSKLTGGHRSALTGGDGWR